MQQNDNLTEHSVNTTDNQTAATPAVVNNVNVNTDVSNNVNVTVNGARKKLKFFNVGNITVMAVLTAVSFILYMFVKFPLPFLFPSFLDIQFSDLPALLGGFALGPVAGSLIVVIKCCLKMFWSTTACVGELGDILVGIAFVLPSSTIYKIYKSKRSAWVGLIVGGVSATLVAVIANRFLLIPFYAEAFGMDAIIKMVSSLYPNASEANFYNYYLPLAVVPFNILRCLICGLITFFVYKPLSKALHWEGKDKQDVAVSVEVATDTNTHSDNK